MREQKVPIGFIQTLCSKNVKGNLCRYIELIRNAAEKIAQIICLQILYKPIFKRIVD